MSVVGRGQAHLVRQRADVVRVGAGHHVLHQRGVGHAADHGAVMQDRLQRMVAVERIAAERRLVAEDPAGGRGDADRAAAVRPVGERGHAARHRRACAAGGAAGSVLQVPRVGRDPPERAVRRARIGELRRGGAHVHDGAGAQQPVHGRGCVVGAEILEDLRAEGGDLALDGVKVLDRHRHAFQRAEPAVGLAVPGLGLLRLLARAVEEVVGDGVDLGVDRLRARDLRVQKLDRREGARLEPRERLARRQITELQISRCHDLPPPWAGAYPFCTETLQPFVAHGSWPSCDSARLPARGPAPPRGRRIRGGPLSRPIARPPKSVAR